MCNNLALFQILLMGPELAGINYVQGKLSVLLRVSVLEKVAIMGQTTNPEEASGPACTILVVDDDEAMRNLFVDALQEQGCRVIESDNGADALNMLKAVAPNVIVTDLRMPDGGFSYLRRLQEGAPECPIVVVTAYGDSQSKAKALECGVQGYFEKPLRISALKAWICQMCFLHPCGNLPLL